MALKAKTNYEDHITNYGEGEVSVVGNISDFCIQEQIIRQLFKKTTKSNI